MATLFQSCFLMIFLLRQILSDQEIKINDECPLNTRLYDLKTLVPHIKMTYSLLKHYPAHDFFTIRNSELYTNVLIDMDSMCVKIAECCAKEKDNCEIIIGVACTENPQSSVITKEIKIIIHDKNDNYPVFKEKTVELELRENLKIGHTISLPIASDDDFGLNRIEMYLIRRQEPQSFEHYFRLNSLKHTTPVIAELKLIKQLDRELINKYSFELLAIDGGYQDRKTGSIHVTIKVIDENDNMPLFTKSLFKETIKEGVASSQPILTLKATDPDEESNGKILYQFDPNSKTNAVFQQHFSINEDTGDITLNGVLDYEKKNSYKFFVIATNPSSPSSITMTTSTATVEITVENVYDEPLQISVDYLTNKNFSVVEENKNNVFVAFISVKSRESDEFRSSINCNFESFNHILNLIARSTDNYKSKSYEVRTITEIDREKLPKIDTRILCKETLDSSIPSSSAPIQIIVTDQNDNDPILSISGKTSVRENTEPGTTVLVIKVVDPDEGLNGKVTFSMEKSAPQSLEYLTIGELDGIIKVKSNIDCEANFVPLTSLNVVVTATDHGIKPRSTDLRFNIDVIDVNDNRPKFNSPLHFNVYENSPGRTIVGEIEVEDRDSKDIINLQLVNRKPGFPFIIVRKSERLFLLNTTRSLDREKEIKFQFNILASDGQDRFAHSITGSVVVEVIDLNDNPPNIIFPPQSNASRHMISYQEPKGYKFMTVSANDIDQTKEFNELEFSLESSNDIFDIDRREGYISTRREMTKNDIGDHVVTVVVSNTANPLLRSSVVINIAVDKSTPKSSIAVAEHDMNQFNSGSLSSNSPGSSEIIYSILIIIVVFVLAIIIAIVIFVLRHYKQEPICLRNLLDKCFRPETTQVESTVYNSNFKSNIKHPSEFYSDQQQVIFSEKFPSYPPDNWMSIKKLDSYQSATNPMPYMKPGYTKLSNPNQFYGNTYQTIDETQMQNKLQDLHLNRVLYTMDNRGKCGANYKSEMNLNTDNLFYEHNPELSQINDQVKKKWISTLTPMPTRSKSVVNRVISNDQTENNFAVVYPQEQSTFV